MAVNTMMLDFSVDPAKVNGETQMSTVAVNVEKILKDFLRNLKLMSNFTLDGGVFKTYVSEPDVLTHLRIFTNGIITITIEYYKAENQEPIFSLEAQDMSATSVSLLQHSKQIEQKIRNVLASYRSKIFPPIKRGAAYDVYLTSSDDRLLEYDIDKVVFEENSPYQKILIVHSKSLGNMLVLDELQNISEADLIYTETLMQRGKENYTNKDICILGGGDGALLYELLKEKPNFVVMLEIDEVVMKACAEHMPVICGDVLTKRSGPNYQIIVDDCIKSLKRFAAEGRKFDYVFGDLTDIPISENPSSELWSFIMLILQLSFKVLKPNGKYMTHGNGASCVESLKMFESQLRKLQPPVIYKKTSAFVPSFFEEWVFYQIEFAEKP